MAVNFYKVNEEYGCFSNFSPHPIMLKGKIWPTTEHYFQAQKFPDTEYEEEIRQVGSPMVAACKGRCRDYPLREDWESVKDDIMLQAVLCKFRTHEDIKEVLLSTGNENIVEKTTNDYYWGCGTKGTGKNMLGIILMQVREILRNEN